MPRASGPLARSLLAALALLAVNSCGHPAPEPVPTPTPTPAGPPTVAEARAFYASQPEYLRPVVPFFDPPAELPNISALVCGSCHREEYAEWSVSTHARAWEDDHQLQAELHKSTPSSDVSWMCANCHTPVEAQLPRLVARLEDGRMDRPVYVDNPEYDEALQLEAITCVTCHMRDGLLLGPWGDSEEVHGSVKSDLLTSEEICTRCHQTRAAFPEATLACVSGTGEEFASGPYEAEGKICQSCHMPEVERPLITGGPVITAHRHWFGGSLIPKKPEYEEEIAPLRDIYPDGLALDWVGLPESLPAGQTATLRLRLENREAGHLLPTGAPERFITVEVTAKDASGAVLATTSERLGAVFQWHPTVELLSDNRLRPREARLLPLELTVPAAGAVTLEVKASKWRMNEENLAHHDLEGKYVPGREFHASVQTVPVR